MKPAIIEKSDNRYLAAYQSEKILDLSEHEVLKTFNGIILNIYFTLSFAVPGTSEMEQSNHLRFLSGALLAEVKNYFKTLKIGELKEAFNNGCRRQYGDFMGISVATFHSWIKGYLSDIKRKELIQSLSVENKRTPLMTADEAEIAYIQVLIRTFHEYKRSGNLEIAMPAYSYDYLFDKGLINFSNKEKEDFFEKAKSVVIGRKKMGMLNPKSAPEFVALKNFIKRYDEDKSTKSDKIEFKREAKVIALKKYFDSIETLKIP